MDALVAVYGRKRFTAAKEILNLAGKPVHQRDDQARALVRRFNENFPEEELRATRAFWAGYGPGMRVLEFYAFWERSGLPWPQDIKSATDWETDLRTLTMASKGTIDAATRDYIVALDNSIAASSFESGRR
jgi:hypothetical protein